MNKKSYFHRVQEQTATRFWINNVTRDEAHLAIEAGAVGCTQNPAYTWKMIDNPAENAYVLDILDKILETEKDDNEALIKLQKALVKNVADVFLPIFEESGGKNGYVSIQGDPFKEDVDTIVRYARYNCQGVPNIMAKVPATKEGLEAIGILAAERIPINATEVMAVKQALDVAEIYGKVTEKISNPAPLYISHIAGIYDEYLTNIVNEEEIDISPDTLWQAGISVAKKAYWAVREKGSRVGFIGGGARGLHHFTEMVGSEFCVTINWKGTADQLIQQDPPVVQRFFQPTPDSVVDELMEKLDDYRRGYLVNGIDADEYEEFGPVVLFRKSFEKSWINAQNYIRQRRREGGPR